MRCSKCGQEISSEEKEVSIKIKGVIGEPCSYVSTENDAFGKSWIKCVIMDRKCVGYYKEGCPFDTIDHITILRKAVGLPY